MAEKIIQLQSSDGVDDLFPTMLCKLEWTNASPSSSYTNRNKVEIDLSKYKMVHIEFWWSTGDNARMRVTVPVGSSGLINGIYTGKQYRAFTTYTDGITFQTCMAAGSATGTMATDDSKCIPYKIYGLA